MIKRDKFIKLSLKRKRKRLIRKRRNIYYLSDEQFSLKNFKIKLEEKIIKNYKSKFFDYLVFKRFITGQETAVTNIAIPLGFCLNNYYNETIDILKEITYSVWLNKGKSITIDFTNCKFVGHSALFLLQILRLELTSEFEKLDKRLTVLQTKSDMKIIKSLEHAVNLDLLMCGFLMDNIEVEKHIKPINTLGYLKGQKAQKHYLENRKGKNAKTIVDYINNCLKNNSYELSIDGEKNILDMVGEILSNAEDHSPFNTYYVTANYKQFHYEDGSMVGELYMSFLNFGFSIYEGFVETKDDNKELYDELKKGSEMIKMSVPFSEDNLFTLYALQDGVSRLKFKDQSRGTGTMKFLNCFFEFGDYHNNEKKHSPNFSILSGKTQLICDNKYKPFIKNGEYFLSLNDDKDLSLPPSKEHLKNLDFNFPGTLLSVSAFLNNEHITKKITSENN
jgi:hypothetical protein